MAHPSNTANTTAAKAIDLLLLFTEERPAWTAQEMAQAFGMPRSTVYRYLNSLRGHGLLVEDETGGFRLGPRIFSLARVARAGTSILRTAAPHLMELRDRYDEAVTLYERAGMDMLFLDRYDSRQRVAVTFARSQLLPWPSHSSAKLLLALAPEPERNACLALLRPVRYTSSTLPDKRALLAELEKIRREGHAVADEEYGAGVWAVAAPIYSGGEARYCLSIAMPKFRIAAKAQLARQMTSAVKEIAARISMELGNQ